MIIINILNFRREKMIAQHKLIYIIQGPVIVYTASIQYLRTNVATGGNFKKTAYATEYYIGLGMLLSRELITKYFTIKFAK